MKIKLDNGQNVEIVYYKGGLQATVKKPDYFWNMATGDFKKNFMQLMEELFKYEINPSDYIETF